MMADFYKFEIANWNEGTANLTLEQEAAYLRVINAIRMADQPITFNTFVLCGLWRCNDRKARRILDELMAAGKVVIEDGKLVNRKAVDDASALNRLRAGRASAGSRGGIESAKARSKLLENNDNTQASASTREEKRREEDKEDIGKPISPSAKPSVKARMPDDWALSDEGWAYARSQGIPDRVIEDEARGFQAYWSDRRDRDASKSERGWEQCWANRCRNIAGRYSPSQNRDTDRNATADKISFAARARRTPSQNSF